MVYNEGYGDPALEILLVRLTAAPSRPQRTDTWPVSNSSTVGTAPVKPRNGDAMEDQCHVDYPANDASRTTSDDLLLYTARSVDGVDVIANPRLAQLGQR